MNNLTFIIFIPPICPQKLLSSPDDSTPNTSALVQWIYLCECLVMLMVDLGGCTTHIKLQMNKLAMDSHFLITWGKAWPIWPIFLLLLFECICSHCFSIVDHVHMYFHHPFLVTSYFMAACSTYIPLKNLSAPTPKISHQSESRKFLPKAVATKQKVL